MSTEIEVTLNGESHEVHTVKVPERVEIVFGSNRFKMEYFAFDAAWAFVHCVENGETKAEPHRRLAAKFLEAYADRYNDENFRFRAQKMRTQTN